MANPFGAIGAGLLGSFLGQAIFAIGIILIIGAIGGTIWYVRYLQKFDIKVEVISTRANIGGVDQYKIFFDKAGIIYDKTDKIWYLRIKNIGVDLPQPPYNVLIPTDKGNMVKIWQKSAEEFVFLLPDKILPIIVKQDGKTYASASVTAKQLEGDVSYWNQKRKERNKDLFNPQSLMMRLLPLIVPLLMFVLVIFMTWMVLKNFSVLGDVANSLRETAAILKGSSSAVVTTG